VAGTVQVDPETGEVDEDFPDDGAGSEEFTPFPPQTAATSAEVYEEVARVREAAEPVSNREHLPLFPYAKEKKPGKRVAYIKVYKLTPPEEGYKGRIGPEATEEFIGRKWGDGTYKFLGVNEADMTIVTRNDVPIAMGSVGQGHEKSTAGPVDGGIKMEDVRRLLLERDQKNEMALRAEREHQARLAKESETRGSQFLALIDSTRKSELENTRLFMQQQQQMQQQAHAQQMQMMQSGFQQTVQLMQAAAAQNNPAVLLKIFQEGMSMGMGVDQEEDPALRAIEVAVGGLKELKDIALNIPKKQKGTGEAPTKKLAPNGAKPNPGAPKTEGGPRSKLSDEERKKLAGFVALCDKKGVDLAGLIDQASVQVGALPDEPDDDKEDEDEKSSGKAEGAAGAAGADSAGGHPVQGEKPQDA
jgi:hypothetical protein